MKEILGKLEAFYDAGAIGNISMLEGLADALAEARAAGVDVSLIFHPVVTVGQTPLTMETAHKLEEALESIDLRVTLDNFGDGFGWMQFEV